MRLHVASHTGTLSPASWAIYGPPFPPRHVGADVTKLLSRQFPMVGVLALGAPLLEPGLRNAGLLEAGWGRLE
jgi:hypothetical protein